VVDGLIVNIWPAVYVVGRRIGAGWVQSEIVSIVYTEQSLHCLCARMVE